MCEPKSGTSGQQACQCGQQALRVVAEVSLLQACLPLCVKVHTQLHCLLNCVFFQSFILCSKAEWLDV